MDESKPAKKAGGAGGKTIFLLPIAIAPPNAASTFVPLLVVHVLIVDRARRST